MGLGWRQLAGSPVFGARVAFCDPARRFAFVANLAVLCLVRERTMTCENRDLNQKVNAPKRDFNPLGFEWEETGNNRIYRIDGKYERNVERLLSGTPKENTELYLAFLRRAKFEGISIVRRLNYIRALWRLKRVTKDLPLADLDKTHIDAFLSDISGTSAGTRQILFYCLRKFLRFAGKGELLAGIKLPQGRAIKVRADDLLTREDLQKMLDSCASLRGRAFITMLYESGARIGEILNLRVSDLEFDSFGVIANLDGKTGRRRVRLVESAEYLRRWMAEARKMRPDEIYLWFGKGRNEPSQYAAVFKFLRQTSKKAGLRKKVYPHLFRHSRASELAQKLKESQLRAFMGWGAASDMPRIYIHLSAQDVDRAILNMYKTEGVKQTGTSLDEIANFFETYKRMKALC